MLSNHRLAILLAFTISGCTGLIYESVWSHYLGLYLGHAAYSQTLTLGIFMGGMTIGAYLVSRRINRIRNALMGYALAELILGVAGLLFHVVYTGLVGFSYDVIFPGLPNSELIGIYKWTSAALLIMPQSIILGCTFPLLCSALIRREQEGIGKHISILYFTNSIGAAAGALLATFLLIPNIGMPGAMLVSGIANIIIAIVVYYLAKRPEPSAVEETSADSVDIDKLTLIVLLTALITGAVSFMYEIAWIRMLNLVLGTSLHAFEIMLSSFIAGLALGGLWIRSRIEKIPDLLRFAGQVQIIMGMAAISTLALYNQSFVWVAKLLSETLQRTDTGYFFYNLATSLISGLIMIPATFCAGMTLPLLTAYLVKKGHNENAIGRVYASNTIGAIIGIVVAVHLGLTLLGLKWLIVVAGLIDIGLGIYLIMYTGKSLKGISMRYRVGASALVALVTISLVTELSPSRLASGSFRYARSDSMSEILYYKDGKTASISVAKEGLTSTISTNGKPDAGLRLIEIDEENPPEATRDEVTMGMLGSLASFIHPNLERVANIGFGSGLTSHIILSNPGVKTLDTIEIEPVMVDAARLFNSRNHLAYDDPRSKIHYDDAKTFFAANQQKYDAIISEPSNPWVMGVGNLFSVEFYQHLKRYLKDDGILVQWLHLYEISLPTLMTALAALDQNFESYDLYATNRSDIILVASPNASIDIDIKLGWEQLPPQLRKELELIGISNMETLVSRKLASKAEIQALLRSNETIAANSDYFPLLSLRAPRDRFVNTRISQLFNMPALGMRDNPFKIDLIAQSDFETDFAHPYKQEVKLARDLEAALIDGESLTRFDYKYQGIIQALTDPQPFCNNADSQQSWVIALYRVAIHANNFGSPELIEKVKALALDFDCIADNKEPASILYDAVLHSINGFSPDSIPVLRNAVAEMQDSNMPSRYQAFVITCYLSSLIHNPADIDQKDFELIGELRTEFDASNLWLESMLGMKLRQQSSPQSAGQKTPTESGDSVSRVELPAPAS